MHAYAHDYSYAEFIRRSAELPHCLGFYTKPSDLIPTTHPSDPLAITLIPQLRSRILKVCFFSIPSTYYLCFYDRIVGLVCNNIKINTTTNNTTTTTTTNNKNKKG